MSSSAIGFAIDSSQSTLLIRLFSFGFPHSAPLNRRSATSLLNSLPALPSSSITVRALLVVWFHFFCCWNFNSPNWSHWNFLTHRGRLRLNKFVRSEEDQLHCSSSEWFESFESMSKRSRDCERLCFGWEEPKLKLSWLFLVSRAEKWLASVHCLINCLDRLLGLIVRKDFWKKIFGPFGRPFQQFECFSRIVWRS